MSLFRPESRLLGCSATSLTLLAAQASSRQPTETLVALRFERLPAAGAGLADRLQHVRVTETRRSASRSLRLHVTLDDALARIFVVTPPSGAKSLHELAATAAARFTALYGEPVDAWRLAADWHAALPFLACALSNESYQALAAFAQAHRWQLASVSPLLARAWNHLRASLPSPGWLLVGHGRTLTVAHCERQGIARVRSMALVSRPTVAELEVLIEQERLRALSSSKESQPPSLLWSGPADWLPTASRMAGLASRTILWPTTQTADADDPARGLALAGACR